MKTLKTKVVELKKSSQELWEMYNSRELQHQSFETEELLGCIHTAHGYLDHLKRDLSIRESRISQRKQVESVTKRERDVLLRLDGGASNKTIAAELGISIETVKEHIANLLQKLGFENRTQLALWAIRNGLIPIEETISA